VEFEIIEELESLRDIIKKLKYYQMEEWYKWVKKNIL
jgi:hypothetical protein